MATAKECGYALICPESKYKISVISLGRVHSEVNYGFEQIR